MKKKELVRGICFLALAALVFQILTTIFIPKWYGTWQSTRIVDGFYELPENTMDVALLGSSQTIMGLSAAELYEHYGIAAYGFGTEEQPLYATYYWLKEILRYQKPAVAVLDVNELIHSCNEAAYRKAFDYMKWSSVKCEAVRTHCESNEELTFMSYLLPLTNYHSRWDELEAEDFTYLTADKTDPYLGFVPSHGTCEISYSGTPRVPEEEADPADPEAYTYLQKIIQLCREQEIELLFVKTPRAGWNPAKHNLVSQVAQEADIPFLDFNDEDIMAAMEFDYMADARDGSHLNIYGAEKVGAYLGNYLMEHYKLSDRRTDSRYDYLKDMLPLYQAAAEDAKLASCETLEELLDFLLSHTDTEKGRYTVFWSVNGSSSYNRFPETILSRLQALGMDTEPLLSGLNITAVSGCSENSYSFYQENGAEFPVSSGKLADGTIYTVTGTTADTADEKGSSSIRINRTEYAAEGEGLHIAVYDPVDQEIIDSVLADLSDGCFLLKR